MELKILVFDPDPGLREMLRIGLHQQGRDVKAFADLSVCSLYRDVEAGEALCRRQTPCADVVIADNNLPGISAIDLFGLQRAGECKALDANKAVMSTRVTREMEEALTEFGCHCILKPFHLAEVRQWVGACEKRLAAQHDRRETTFP